MPKKLAKLLNAPKPQENQELIDFLNKIALIESSGGKDLAHKELTYGMHKGSSAIGKYGLMPNTIKEILNRQRLEKIENPEIKTLETMDDPSLKQYLEQNPQSEEGLAQYLGNRVLKRMGGDQEKAAFAWNQGSNLTPAQIEERKYKDADYVKKFQKLLQPQQPPLAEEAPEEIVPESLQKYRRIKSLMGLPEMP